MFPGIVRVDKSLNIYRKFKFFLALLILIRSNEIYSGVVAPFFRADEIESQIFQLHDLTSHKIRIITIAWVIATGTEWKEAISGV